MYRSVSALCILAVSAAGALAQAPAACPQRPYDPANCVPMVGCLGSGGVYFTGHAMGRNEGTFAVTTSTGVSCQGDWVGRNRIGMGEAVFTCDDGSSGIGFFTYLDSATGTATGKGLMDNGRFIEVWTGHNVDQFIRNRTGDVDARLMCGDVEIPLS